MSVLSQLAGATAEAVGTKTTLVEVVFPPEFTPVMAKNAIIAHAIWVKRGQPKWNSAVQLPLVGECYPAWDQAGEPTFLRRV